MTTTYERTCQIERAAGESLPGQIAGVLTTDGEASDGHILNIAGAEIPERAPLLFGHDDYTGTGNLGSWESFDKYSTGKKLGQSGIRGIAQIELDGEGPQAQWRADVNLMIEKRHINQFSVRWTETEEPIERVNLPSDHPAFVDAKKAKGRKRWGFYFEKWRLLEGSVVTLGADPAALIGRLAASDGDVRTYWRRAINEALAEAEVVAPHLVAIPTPSGPIYIERAAYDVMLETANERLSLALDTVNDAMAFRAEAEETLRDAEAAREEAEAAKAEAEEIRAAGVTSAATSAPEPKKAAPLPAIQTPGEIVRAIRIGLERAKHEIVEETRASIRTARGQVG